MSIDLSGVRERERGAAPVDWRMESVTPPSEPKSWLQENAMMHTNVEHGVPAIYVPQQNMKMPLQTSILNRDLSQMASTLPSSQANTQNASTAELLTEQQNLNRQLQQDLSKIRNEVDRLREIISEYEWERQQKDVPRAQTRYWTAEEHERFLDALKKFGPKEVRSIAAYVGTRSATQVRTHSQKYFLRIQRESRHGGAGMGSSSTSDGISKARRRCMSEGDLTKVERRHKDANNRSSTSPRSNDSLPMQASPLSKQPSGIDLLSLVASETMKKESAS